jgi:hypothetical protein
VLAAAVLPHPPLLVPDLAAGAANLIAPLLAACESVVAEMLALKPRAVVLIGSGATTRIRPAQDTGTLAGFGTGFGAGFSAGIDAEPETVTGSGLPLSLTIGRWLLERAGWSGDVVLQEVAADASAEECEQLGARLAVDSAPDSVWLALGDGSNRRGPRSPGHDDPRAAGFDAEVVRAFASADLPALRALDPELAAVLGAAGRPAWQVLAGAVGTASGWTTIGSRVHYDEAPFGVEYLVADWRPGSVSAASERNENS